MIYRSRAPLRIGLAGGGTDVSPYCDLYGGAVLNVTISLFANASIELINEDVIIFEAVDRNEYQKIEWSSKLTIDGKFDLMKGVYNRIQEKFTVPQTGFKLATYVDAPSGSGLGASSTLVVAILGAFTEMLKLPLDKYGIARLAYQIEREDLGLQGGRQDQFCAVFGGMNYMEFLSENKVIVNPIQLNSHNLLELEHNLLLYYTSMSRESSTIIARQSQNVLNKSEVSINAMHHLKEQVHMLSEALSQGRLHEIGRILDYGFQQKKQMADGISNTQIEKAYETAIAAGATGGKVSGAGGGGFMIFYCPNNTKYKVAEALSFLGGYSKSCQFTDYGLTTWSI